MMVEIGHSTTTRFNFPENKLTHHGPNERRFGSSERGSLLGHWLSSVRALLIPEAAFVFKSQTSERGERYGDILSKVYLGVTNDADPEMLSICRQSSERGIGSGCLSHRADMEKILAHTYAPHISLERHPVYDMCTVWCSFLPENGCGQTASNRFAICEQLIRKHMCLRSLNLPRMWYLGYRTKFWLHFGWHFVYILNEYWCSHMTEMV